MELPFRTHGRTHSYLSSATEDDLATFSATRLSKGQTTPFTSQNLAKIFALKTLSNETSKIVGIESMVSLLKTRVNKAAYLVYKMHGKIRCISITENGRYCICGDSSGYLYLKDLYNEIEMDLQIAEKAILSLATDSKKDRVYIATKDSNILVWSLNKLKIDQKISIEDTTYAMCLNSNGKLLFTAGCNEVVYIMNTDNNEVIAELEGHEEPIRALAVTRDDHILASGGEDHILRLWNVTEKCEIGVLKGHDDSINSLLFSSDEIIVSAGSDKTIRIWSLSQKNCIHIITGHEDVVNSICMSSDNRYLISASSDRTVRLWSWKDKALVTILSTLNDKVTAVAISPDCSSVYSGGHEEVIYKAELDINLKIKPISDLGSIIQSLYYDATTSKIIAGNYDNTITCLSTSTASSSTYTIHENRVSCLLITPDSSYIISSSTDAGLSIINTRTGQVETKLKGHEGNIFCLCVSNDSKYIVSGSMDSTIRVWNLATKQEEDKLIGHEYWVTALYLSKDNKYLISGSGDKTIKIWDFTFRVEIFTLSAHSDRVNCIKMTHDMSLIISGSEDKSIKVWGLKEREMRHEFLGHTRGVQCLIISENDKYLYSGSSDCTIRIWGIFDKIELAIINQPYSILDIYLIDSGQNLLILQNKKVYKLENPLHLNSAIWIYPTQYSILFITYISSILKNSNAKFDEDWVKYMVFPWRLNLLHIFSYLTNDTHLKRALKKGSHFIPISSGENPLSISINRRSLQCEEAIIKRMKKYIYPHNAQCYRYIEQLLPLLNKSSLPSLNRFYEQVFSVSNQPGLPAFGCLKQKPPIVKLSDCENINPSDFLIMENLGDKDKEEVIVFRKSLLCMNLVAGSSYSLQFFRTLIECENADVFRTKFIHAILAYKWQKVVRFVRIQALLYGILLAFLTAHIFSIHEISYITMICILNSLFSIYNLVQIYVLKTKFLISLWNMLDLSRNILIWVYISMLILDQDFDKLETLSIITLIAWLRVVGYFRIFDRTRYLINMILEVIKDMVPFLVIMVVSTLAFGLVFYISNMQEGSSAFLSAYQINFSSFNVILNGSFQTAVFILSCIVNPLIMMNLLIAIMGDTYDRVRDGLEVADHKEMAECIFEIECLLFWRRDKADWKYIHQVTTEENSENLENEWSGKIRAITNSVHSLDTKSKLTRKSVERIEEMLAKSSQSHNNKSKPKKKQKLSSQDHVEELIKKHMKKLHTEFSDEIHHVNETISDLKSQLVEIHSTLSEIKSYIIKD